MSSHSTRKQASRLSSSRRCGPKNWGSFSTYLINSSSNDDTNHRAPRLSLEEARKQPKTTKTMKPNARRFNPIACLSLAVILYTAATATLIRQNVYADQSDNSQLVPHHSSQSVSLFKDLSGPTSGKIQTLDVICGKNFMTVRAEFSAPFYGIVFSKGTYGHENCIYVKPNSGLTHAAFNVYYDQCGTKPDLQGKFYENTIVIQYGSDIIEAYDEAKRLRCEWFEAYEKPATFKPAIPVADLEVVEMNFQGDDIDCWMEIQEGSGPWSREVSKIVPVGQPMTIVVAINDYNGQFDMRVKSCVAHDGVQQPISLTDEYGCVLRPKMLTPFTKIKNPGGHKKATVLSYSRFLAFKFPDSMTVQIQCTVEVCRHGCADACQRVPSIAATTLQPELSLTAKWPAAPNQPAIEAPRPPPQKRFQDTQVNGVGGESVSAENPMSVGPAYKPARMQFSQRQPIADNDQRGAGGRLPGGLSAFHSSGNELMAPDDMSISDSNQQASIINSAPPQQQQQQQPYHQHRSPVREPQRRGAQEPPLPSMIDSSRISQYLVPNSSRRRTTTSTTPSASSSTTAPPTTTTTTTTSTSTTTTAAPPASPEQDNRSNPVSTSDETSEYSSSDDQLTRLNSEQPLSADNKQASDSGDSAPTPGESADNKPEASQVKPTLAAMPPTADQEQPAQNEPPSSGSSGDNASGNGDNTSANNRNTPGQGDETPVDQSGSGGNNRPTDNEGSGSSLKTVEVEIPANEDPVRSLISGSSQSLGANGNAGGQFNSNRMSNVDLNGYTGYLSNQDMRQNVEFPTDYKQQQVNEQVIQPREVQVNEKRDKGEDTSNIEAMMANVKNRFGARSQPQSSVQHQPQHAIEPPPLTHYNHQMSSADQQSPDARMKDGGSDLMNPDRVLIDRSDDSSSLTEIASSSSEHDSTSGKSDSPAVEQPESQSAEESSPAVSVDTSGTNGKVKPVVGTEELATGPLQIEDRMGAPAQQPTLEEALLKLQQQVPQTAALMSGSSQEASQKAAPPTQEQKSSLDSNQALPSVVQTSLEVGKTDVASERVDVGSDSKRHFHSTDSGQQIRQAPVGIKHNAQSEISQPFPNIQGQQKVIPDPSSGLNTRNSLLTQASNQEANGVLQPNGTPLHNQKPQGQQSVTGAAKPHPTDSQEPIMQHQIVQQPKPVAQITNVPINIGFPQSQIPAIQQLTQQLAYFQQQQQHQQQPSITTTTTAKPSRGRFSLLSPQAALQAVASRFLPKSQQAQHAQQKPQQPQLPLSQLPPAFDNMKHLTPEQQQKLFASQVASLQQQQQSPKYLLQKQTAPQLSAQQYQLPNRYAQSGAQTGSNALMSGLFGRLNNAAAQHQSQPLVRSRRSAMIPNGKRGSGEVGITKTFMVVTGMDLAFLPNATDTELPPILEGRRLVEDDVIYGVCMPVVSLTFVLTCAFWLIVFIFSFCIYMLMKSRRQQEQTNAFMEKR